MKKAYYLILLFTVCFFGSSSAQFVNYMDDSGWNLGFNLGGTWQEKEAFTILNEAVFMQPFTSVKGGFTVGKTVFYIPKNRFFSFDLRFRYLRGENYGWATNKDSINDVDVTPTAFDTIHPYGYRNYKMDLNEFSLEGVLTFEKLREKTGVLLYGFAGIGLVDYRIKADYLDKWSLPYDFTLLDSDNPRNMARDIKRLSDLEFETTVEGTQIKFMPSLGVGFGYQITPQMSIGLEHKITYALHNNLDGKIVQDQLNDRYHYTAIRMNFDLFNGSYGTYSEPENDPPNPTTSTENANSQNDEVYDEPVGQPPVVNITYPVGSNSEVNVSNFFLNARLYNIKNKDQITFIFNGNLLSNFEYSFNSSTAKLTKQLSLNSGINSIQISAKNSYGEDQDQKIIIYNPNIISPPPSVIITSPSQNPHVSSNPLYRVNARVLNVESSSQIQVLFNNVEVNNFTYLPTQNQLEFNASLLEGSNKVFIKAINSYGRSSDETTIEYLSPQLQNPPIISFIYPVANPYNTSDNKVLIKGKIKNVEKYSDANAIINNDEVRNLLFNPASENFQCEIQLQEGANIFKIEANNEFGTSTKTISINYTSSECDNPVILLTSPSSDYVNTDNSRGYIKAVVNYTQNIKFYIDGIATQGYTFDLNTGDFEVSLNLKRGSNTFLLEAYNACGAVSETITYNYQINNTTTPIPTNTKQNNEPNPADDNDYVKPQIEEKGNNKGNTFKVENETKTGNNNPKPITNPFKNPQSNNNQKPQPKPTPTKRK
tara:strand:+ start:321 stop:2624 length:2304 start_codon:yes stop_codon:yes gene_type:complete